MWLRENKAGRCIWKFVTEETMLLYNWTGHKQKLAIKSSIAFLLMQSKCYLLIFSAINDNYIIFSYFHTEYWFNDEQEIMQGYMAKELTKLYTRKQKQKPKNKEPDQPVPEPTSNHN